MVGAKKVRKEEEFIFPLKRLALYEKKKFSIMHRNLNSFRISIFDIRMIDHDLLKLKNNSPQSLKPAKGSNMLRFSFQLFSNKHKFF